MVEKRGSKLKDYRGAQLAARRTEGALRAAAVNDITASLRRWADQLAKGIANLPGGEAGVRETVQLLRSVAQQLETSLLETTGAQRRLAFGEVQRIWREAALRVANAQGVPLALMGAVRNPPLSLLGAFENIGGAHHWKTLIPKYVSKAAEEANGIVRGALLQGVSPPELARRLRPYVSGAETFYEAFGDLREKGIDLRMMKAVDAEAARSLRYNTMRIAVSETHNARSEAEVQHFLADPFVRAVAWRLAPDRGSVEEGDECDVLASENFYGLGPGVYPVTNVPVTPHPFDRCERVPVTQDRPGPKPTPALAKDPIRDKLKLPKGLTAEQGERVRARLGRVLGLSENEALKQAHAQINFGAQLAIPGTELPSGDELFSLEEAKARIQGNGTHLIVGQVGKKVSSEALRTSATTIANGLDDLRAVGFGPEDFKGVQFRLVAAGENGNTALFNSSPFRSTIEVNAQERAMRSLGRIRESAAYQQKVGWWASDHVNQHVHHEFGHYLHFRNRGLSPLHWAQEKEWASLIEDGSVRIFSEKLGRGWTRVELQDIARRVSRYATTNSFEFVAETFAGLVNGSVYDVEVMTLYRQLGGVVPKGSLKSPVAATAKAKPTLKLVPAAPPPIPAPIPIPEPPVGGSWRDVLPKGKLSDRDILRVGLRSGATPEDVISEVIKRNPASKVNAKTVRSVLRELKKAGLITAQEEIVLAQQAEAALQKITELVPLSIAKKVRADLRKFIRQNDSDEAVLHLLRAKYGVNVNKLTVADVAFRRQQLGTKGAVLKKVSRESKPLGGKQAKKHLDAYFEKYRERLSKDLIDDVRGYQGSSFHLNASLRKGNIVSQEAVRNLEAAIERAPPLQRDLIVYRGAGLNWAGEEKLGGWKGLLSGRAIGTTFVDLGFTSTSLKRSTASDFGSLVFRIRLPKGTRGIWVNSVTRGHLAHEQEFVLARGTRFRIVDVIKRPDTWLETKERVTEVVLEIV